MADGPPIPAARRALIGLRALYFLHFAGGGLGVPYLTPFLESRGVGGGTIGLLLAGRNLVYLVWQPFVGVAADRVGIGRVLRVVATLGAAVPALFFLPPSTGWLAVAFVLLALTHGPIAGLADASTVSLLEREPARSALGGPSAFGRSRLFGSIGFASTSLLFGLAMAGSDPARSSHAAIVMVAWLAVAAAPFAFLAPVGGRSAAPAPPRCSDAARLFRSPGVALVLATGCLQWITLSPYHNFFGAHVEHRGGGPLTIGLSIAIAVATEIVVMATAPRWLARIAPRHVMAASAALGTIRWSLTAYGGPAWIVAAQALHGMSYGAFYVSLVDAIVRRTPPELRATAQALIGSVAMGLGTFLGNLAAGPLYALDRGPSLFLAAAGFSVVPALVALAIPPAPRAPAATVV